MKSLVIDDHKINYVLIKSLLNEHFPEFDIIDAADSVSRALQMLDVKSYDIIFLDMKLGDGEGFEVLKEITEFVFVVVISSHKDYALEAFKYNVSDYLVKPVKPEEFQRAVSKVLELHKRLGMDKEVTVTARQLAENKKILINHRNEYVAVGKADISFIKAQGKYSEIHTVRGEVYLSSKNLKEFENALEGRMIRIHNSYLVNIDAISSYSREDSTVSLVSGIVVPVSVRKREELYRIFSVF